MLLPVTESARARARSPRLRRIAPQTADRRLLLAIVLVAAAVRLATLSSQSYWLDESQAAHELSLSFGHMLGAWNRAEWNPPLYLIVAWPWARVFGTGEVGLRLLSALLGIGLVPLLYLCGAELVSRRAGLVAAALGALNPFMIWYSQEAREYMLLTVLSAASLLFFARGWRTGSRRDLGWWAAFSALALLTQYFAGFLVLAEGVALIYRLRSRTSIIALLVQGVVLAPFVPHVVPRLSSRALFITSQPLSLRLQQVPVTFALNTLYKSSLVTWGLVGAAGAAAVVIGLLLVGAGDRELRGAGLAAGVAAAVLLIPLGLALVGHDDYLAVGLMPAWPPLAVVFAAACTGRRARIPGAALAAVLLALFVWAGFRIGSDAAYQRPDWRGVAAALGRWTPGSGTRAIVAYPNQFATGPLSFYLKGTPWAGPGEKPGTDAGPATITELDIVANAGQPLSGAPAGVRLVGQRVVDGYVVDRFRLPSVWRATAPQIIARADGLLSLAPPAPAVMIQRTPASA